MCVNHTRLCAFLVHLHDCCCLYHQIADYYYDERMCLLRCVLLLLTYFQDERHPFRVTDSCFVFDLFAVLEQRILEIVFHNLVFVLMLVQTEYCNCVNKLEKDLINNYQAQFEKLFKAEAPTWETHGNLMVTWREKCQDQTFIFDLIKNA